MYLDVAKKKEIFEEYGKSNTDTGSAESQIALFSYRIAHLTEHMKVNKKDYTTERSLLSRRKIREKAFCKPSIHLRAVPKITIISRIRLLRRGEWVLREP